MADVTLKDGREIDFDLDEIKVKDWNKLVDIENPPTREYEYELIAKTCDLDAADFPELSVREYKRLVRAFYKKATSPEEDPKAES